MSSTKTSLTNFANALREVLDMDPLPELGKRKAKSEEERFCRDSAPWTLQAWGAPTPKRGSESRPSFEILRFDESVSKKPSAVRIIRTTS